MEAIDKNGGKKFQKSYFDVLGLCCPSEIPLIERVLNSLDGIKNFSVIVPTKTVIVVHDSVIISQIQIVKALNQARLEANVRVSGATNYKNKWPNPYALGSGLLLALSFLKYVYSPFKWLALGAIAVGIAPILLKAVSAVRNLTININIIVLIAVSGSVALRDYWEAGTMVFLYTIAEWLESRATHKATAVMSSLISVVPQRAVLADTGEEINADEVSLNTILAVKAGEVIPIDGVVVEGNCEVDEKFLTGESFPVAKQKDSTVWASTINLNGYITVKTMAVAEDCVATRMAKLVEDAQNKKSRTQRFMDKCAKYYIPAIGVISASLAMVPVAFRVQNKTEWYHLSLVVLVSGCPCALLLSTPVAMFCALSEAAGLGVLFKGAEHLETLALVKIMAFDKTGTITRGEFLVADFKSLQDNISLNTLLHWTSSIESKSSHPMAVALVDFARAHAIEPQPEKMENFQIFPGEGIYGRIENNGLYIGNWKVASRAGCSTVPKLEGYDVEGKSVGYIFLGSTPAGIFSLSDACRTGGKEALEELKSMGIKTVMLTGDSHAAAKHAQAQLGGALEVVHAELLPDDKGKMIKELQKEGPTAMIGDGVNDAPALATADIGISMGVSGSALATETGDVVLMSNDIQRIPKALQIAKKVRRKIIENVVIAISIKAAILGLAIAGHPLVWAAVVTDVGTCLLVIFNSMLLLQGIPGQGKKCCQPTNKCDNTSGCSSHTNHSSCIHIESQRKCIPKCSSSDPSSCGNKKCLSSAQEHDHKGYCHQHNEARVAEPQCCRKGSQDLESQRVDTLGCSKNASCCKKNSCATEDELHQTAQKQKCQHENDSTCCKKSPQSPASDHEQAMHNSHCTENPAEVEKCCMDAPRKEEDHSKCEKHAFECCRQLSPTVSLSGCCIDSDSGADEASNKMQTGCCDSFGRECCLKNGLLGASFGGGLSEIVIEQCECEH